MHDVLDSLRTLTDVVAPGPAPAETVAADLARGQRALIRRRRNRIAGSSLAVAAAAAVAVGGAQLEPAGSQPPVAGGSAATAQQAARVQLVSYTGPQPAGFRIATVPAGWQVDLPNGDVVAVAPPAPGSSPAAPSSVVLQDPAADGSSVSFDRRIAVVLQGNSRLPSDTPVTKVSVNGRDGLLGHTGGGEGLWLIFPDAAGNKVLVQVPTSVGLTTDQIITFAQGITVTGDAHSVGG